MSKLSHIDEQDRPTMVDVSDKLVTERQACARSIVSLPDEVVEEIDGDDIGTKKGPVFATAIIAGVMAAKKTHELIPFCHPLGLENCEVTISMDGNEAVVECLCKVHHKTGVEMEALTGASVAALTIYDMAKALEKEMVIENVRLEARRFGVEIRGTEITGLIPEMVLIEAAEYYLGMHGFDHDTLLERNIQKHLDEKFLFGG